MDHYRTTHNAIGRDNAFVNQDTSLKNSNLYESKTSQLLNELFENRHNYSFVNQTVLKNAEEELKKLPQSSSSRSSSRQQERPPSSTGSVVSDTSRVGSSILFPGNNSNRRQQRQHTNRIQQPRRGQQQQQPFSSPAHSDKSYDSGYTDEELRAITAASLGSQARYTKGSLPFCSVSSTQQSQFPSPNSSYSESRPLSVTPSTTPYYHHNNTAYSPTPSYNSTCFEQTPPQHMHLETDFDGTKFISNNFPVPLSLNSSLNNSMCYGSDSSQSNSSSNSVRSSTYQQNKTESSKINELVPQFCLIKQTGNKSHCDKNNLYILPI